jgi:SNF2-related domain
MQEIRSTTTKIAQTCEKLDCNRRWMLSGTPLFDGIDDLRGELNFLRLEPFGAKSEDGFFKFMITDPWESHKPSAIETLKVLSSVMLRRSKSMTIKATGAPILGLKPLTVEFSPIQQTNSERAIYYFLESIVARVLRSSSDSKRTSTSRRVCLRLLQDTCNSAVSDNGELISCRSVEFHGSHYLISRCRRFCSMAGWERRLS